MAVTDINEQMVNTYAYTPFGTIGNDVEGIPQPFKYAGQHGVMTEPNGLNYMRARFYDPQVCRFISEDPIGFAGGDLNLYVYCRNNPIMFVDPRGLDIWIEGRSGSEPYFHQSINIGDPLGKYTSISFGITDPSFGNFTGNVYMDIDKGGKIISYLKTTPEQDSLARKDLLRTWDDDSGKLYGLNTCRSYSQSKFNHFKKKFKP